MGITERITNKVSFEPYDRGAGTSVVTAEQEMGTVPIGMMNEKQLRDELAYYRISIDIQPGTKKWRTTAMSEIARERRARATSSREVDPVESRKAILRPEFARVADPFRNTLAANEIMVFHNGHEPYQPLQTAEGKARIGKVCEDVLLEECGDYFTEQGKVKEEAKAEWSNVCEIVKPLGEIMLDRESDIRLLPEEQVGEVLRFCVKVAKNPDILGETVITTGIGGTIDEFSSSRLPAYIAPALRMAEKFRLLYEQRQASYIREGRIRKHTTAVSQKHERLHGTRMDFQDVKRIQQELRAAEDDRALPELTEDEVGAINTRFAIATKYPTVRAFTAKETAIMCNFPHNADTVRARAAEAQSIFTEFQQTFFPRVEMEFLTDTPEAELTPVQRAMDRYLTHELRTLIASSPQFASTVYRLEAQGGRRGEHASEHVDDYVQRHVPLFGDPLALPKDVTSILRKEVQTDDGIEITPRIRADHTIMIGGEPEGPFWKLRRELTASASAERYCAFLQRDIADIQSNPARREERKEVATLEALAAYIQEWSKNPENKTKGTNISVLTAVKLVPYFVDKLCDVPFGTDPKDTIANLEARPDEMQDIPLDEEKIREALEKRSRRKSIIRDFTFLDKVQKEQLSA